MSRRGDVGHARTVRRHADKGATHQDQLLLDALVRSIAGRDTFEENSHVANLLKRDSKLTVDGMSAGPYH